MISYEYEYFGSARTPVTKSSTKYKRPHRILVLLHSTYDEYVRIIRVRVKSTWSESPKKYEQTQE